MLYYHFSEIEVLELLVFFVIAEDIVTYLGKILA